MKLKIYKSNICKTLREDIEFSRGLNEEVLRQIDALGEDLNLVFAARDEFSRRFGTLKNEFAHLKDVTGKGSSWKNEYS